MELIHLKKSFKVVLLTLYVMKLLLVIATGNNGVLAITEAITTCDIEYRVNGTT
jgi:hypothetical protein